ncbi:Golgi-associated plant pathogenesis-related protein 1 [Orchesella cincta]|uniref:Golgi-associated plant pathogenesis-related protein 1 n=1 Tax=Orchesella cincta TaxID=48709 RepID=A0A1D2MVI4_ORCCI|nr:Golgi-associated plant pathogenesis-related protein 1 [Orchesella cincta]
MTPEKKVLFVKIGLGLIVASMLVGYTYVWVQWVDLEAARESALILNNYYRARHGSAPLTRNADLDMIAQMCALYYRDYVPGGSIDHSCPYWRSGYNFYFSEGIGECGGGSPTGSPEHLWTNIEIGEGNTWMLYKEIYNYNFSNFKTDLETHPRTVLHFTQVVWRESKYFGLGMTTYRSKKGIGMVATLFYYPSGNLITDDWAHFLMNVRPVLKDAPALEGWKKQY